LVKEDLNQFFTRILTLALKRVKNDLFIKRAGAPIILIILFTIGTLALPTVADDRQTTAVIDSINALPYEYIVSHIYRSITLFTQNAQNARSLGYLSGEGRALSQLGLAYYLHGDYDEATECYVRAFQIFEELGDFQNLAGVYGEYGYQLKRRDLAKAVDYMQRAIGLAEKKKLSDPLRCKLYDNYGVIKEMQDDFDGAMAYYDKAYKMKRQAGDSIGIPYSLNKIAGLKARQGKYREAYAYLSQSDQYRAKEKGDFGRTENLALWADIYFMEGKIEAAINKYNQCLQAATALGYTFLQQYCHQQLSESYKLKNDFKRALEHYQLYANSQDSVNDQKNREIIADLEINYETAQKDKLLAAQEFKLQQRTLLLLIAAVSIGFLGLLTVWIYNNQKQKIKRIKREMELQTKLQEAELENKISAEKLRISRELHDNVGSRLTYIISSLDNLLFAKLPNMPAKKISTLRGFSKETLDDLRNTIWAMKSEAGTVEQLALKIREYVQKLTANNDQVNILVEQHLSKDIQLSSIQMLNLYRIIQEALQNSIKHANPTKIVVRFASTPEGFSLSIQDNGCGFDCSQTYPGNGIPNMQVRCQEAGGTMHLQSNANGTTVECQIQCI